MGSKPPDSCPVWVSALTSIGDKQLWLWCFIIAMKTTLLTSLIEIYMEKNLHLTKSSFFNLMNIHSHWLYCIRHFKITYKREAGDGSVVRIACSCQGLGFSSQHQYGDSQLPVTPVPDLLLMSTGTGYVEWYIHTCKQSIHTHKVSKLKNNF